MWAVASGGGPHSFNSQDISRGGYAVKHISDRLSSGSAPERGMTLIEVMVAMFIFGLVSIGLIYTMTSVLSVTRDSRVRQVAANLAAQEVDLARDIEDVANYGGGVRDVTLNGDTFKVTRTSSWVTNPTTTLPSCGTSGGTLRYKQIHVEVTWGGMRGDTGVITDTLINPNERVTHPDFGTIAVTVQNSVPTGFAGVTVTAREQGASTIVETAVTDANGCAYLLMMPEGYYDLTIEGPSHEQFISVSTGGTPLEVTNAIPGESSEVLFEVSVAATLNINYVHDGTSVTLDQLPVNMDTSLISTVGTNVARRGTDPFPGIAVVPLASTTVVAGDIIKCLANDPQRWEENGDWFAGERVPAVAADSGDVITVDVPVRLVEMRDLDGLFVTAVSRNNGPGCNTPLKYEFTESTSDSRFIALPYGHWQLYAGGSLGSTYYDLGDYGHEYFRVTGNDSIYSSDKTVLLEPRVDRP